MKSEQMSPEQVAFSLVLDLQSALIDLREQNGQLLAVIRQQQPEQSPAPAPEPAAAADAE